MNVLYVIRLMVLTVFFTLLSCDSTDSLLDDTPKTNERSSEITQVSKTQASPRSDILVPSKVLMQAFYWDVEPLGEWWTTIESKIDDWSAAGFDAIWIPPISKGQSGGFSMGYDPFDFFDFGDFDQHGSTKTRFGNLQELQALINKAHGKNIAVISDIVINHNSGGDLEYNPFTQTQTYTSFNPKSDKFNRNAVDFHPNNNSIKDDGVFAGFPDLDLTSDYVSNWIYKTDVSVANYYMNTLGIDGWRFDYVKGYSPLIVKDWLNHVGGWSVGEYFDGNTNLIKEWIDQSNSMAFDFPNFFNMRNAFRNKDLKILDATALYKVASDKAVTFVGNHDTENRQDNNDDFPNTYQPHAYAYIMCLPAMPSVFYTHYETDGQKDIINKLIEIRENNVAGEMEALYSSATEYVVYRKGEGDKTGVILYINLSDKEVTREVTTEWKAGNLEERMGNYFIFQPIDSQGKVSIKAPMDGYSIWTFTSEEQIVYPEAIELGSTNYVAEGDVPNLNGKYSVTLSLDKRTSFKLNGGGKTYGKENSSEYSGKLSESGSEINLDSGSYHLEIDLINEMFDVSSWAIIGDSTPNQWNDPDYDMNYTMNDVWETTVTLVDGELKFRKNNGWDVNYGGSLDALSLGGENIQVNTGTYNIALNLDALSATITQVSWGIIGNATPLGWGEDTDLTYNNTNRKWETTIDMVVGEYKFRMDNAWDVNLGTSSEGGTKLSLGGANFSLEEAGNYTIELDVFNRIYSIIKN